MVSAKQTKVYQEKGKTVNNALDCPCLAGGLTSLTTSCILCLQSHGKKSFSIVTASSTLPFAQKPYDMPHVFLLRTKMLYLKPLHEFSILEKCKLFPKSFIRLGFFFFSPSSVYYIDDIITFSSGLQLSLLFIYNSFHISQQHYSTPQQAVFHGGFKSLTTAVKIILKFQTYPFILIIFPHRSF